MSFRNNFRRMVGLAAAMRDTLRDPVIFARGSSHMHDVQRIWVFLIKSTFISRLSAGQ